VRRHQYPGRRERRIDFWAAFAAWFLFNGAAAFVIQLNSTRTVVAPALAALVVLANVAVPIALAFTRSYMAFGILMAFATAFTLTIVAGVFFTVGDFVGAVTAGGTAGSNAYLMIGAGFVVVGVIAFTIGAFFVLRAIHRSIR